MNNAVSQSAEHLETLSLETGIAPDAGADPCRSYYIENKPPSLDEFAHALRQPLSTIESLAYYLELTNEDDQVCRHLRQIRTMVDHASRILDRAAT